MSEPETQLTTNENTPRSVVERSSRSFMGHAKLIGALTLVSRIMGLAREVVAGHYLGTGLVASAFTVAFTIPNLFRKLFGEGALSAAFIPLYAQALKRDELEGRAGLTPDLYPDDHANVFAAASVNLLAVMLLAITIVGEIIIFAVIFADPHMRVDHLMTLRLTAIMLPYVLLICGTAFLGAILQVHHRFGAPAFAPVLLNICHICVVFIGARLLGMRNADAAAVVVMQTKLAYWLAFFVVIAGVMQLCVLLPGLRAVGFRFRLVLHFWTPPVRKMMRMTAPVAVGAGVLQLSVLMDKAISVGLMQGAPHAHDTFHFLGWHPQFPMELGAPARLNLAQFLYQFPLGVFAIALATAIFPGLSAKALDQNKEQFKSVLRHGIEATLWEGIPASLGLILVREPAVRLLFQHGQISAHDAELISQSVLYYSGAIWAFSLLQILNRAYYAMHDTMTPLIMSVLNIVLNLVVEIPLLWWFGEAAMAIGTLVSFAIQAVITLWLLDRRVGGLGLGQSAGPVVKMVVATAVMWAACAAAMHTSFYAQLHGRIGYLVQMTTIMAVGAAVYLGACAAMGVSTMEQFKRPKKPRVPTTP